MGDGELLRGPAEKDTGRLEQTQSCLESVFAAHGAEGIIVIEDSHLHAAPGGPDQCGIYFRVIYLINRQRNRFFRPVKHLQQCRAAIIGLDNQAMSAARGQGLRKGGSVRQRQ